MSSPERAPGSPTKGTIWLVLGAALGIAVGVVHVGYFSGAAGSLSDTAQRIVHSGGLTLVRAAPKHGWFVRLVNGVSAVLGLLVPGVTALLLVATARASLRLRVLVGWLVLVLGIAGYHYLGNGAATGTLLLAIVAAAIAVVATGPLIAAPLVALAALIGTEFLPRLFGGRDSVPHASVVALHDAIFGTLGAPYWLVLVVLALAVVPFALAARLVVR
ncbi:MAG: hypothetical protein ACLPQS_11720 [Acidimicrobiales bacterium]